MSDAAPLRVEHLSVELGGQGVLQDVSLTAASGEWLGVIGPNGSGKTTLLRAVSGAVAGDGRIELFGKPLRVLGGSRTGPTRRHGPPAVGRLV